MALIQKLKGITPEWGQDTYLAPSCNLIGDVRIGSECSIWHQAVLRGDVMPIRIGNQTNIQDGTIIHGTYKKWGTTLGDRVTVGHGVILHGCTIANECLIGMDAVIMDDVEIGEHCLVGAGTLLPAGKKIPPRSLVMGRPGKVVRQLTDDEVQGLKDSADHYIKVKNWYFTEET